MSVTGPSNTSASAASSRLSAAIGRTSTPHAASDAITRATAAVAANRAQGANGAPDAMPVQRAVTAPTQDAVRGAGAGPDDATGDGARNVQSIAPGGDTTAAGGAAYSPYEASSDAYAASSAPAAQGAGTAPAGQAVETQQALVGEPSTASTQGASSPTSVAGTGAWTPQWQSTFEELALAPADIEYLANGNYGDDQLAAIANQLSGVDTLDPSTPEPGVDASSVGSANGPLEGSVPGEPGIQGGMDTADGAGSVQGTSAWSPEWKSKFGDLMKRMGLPDAKIQEQLAGVESQPLTEPQLQEAYRQMEASLGDFDDAWRQKFSTLMDELKTPADVKEESLAFLAGSGMTDADLQAKYDEAAASKPAWSPEYESKFKSLDVPDELLKQVKDSGAPKEALDQQFQKLLDTKMKYSKDGRLGKLQEAGATPAEKWGIMLEGKEGKDFDKVLEQVHSAHVSGWQRVGSFALNLIPGVYAVQFLTGKDWVTGEKIDRTNPLNIVGAVASGFAGFTAVRGAIAGVQGLSAASRAATATMSAAKAATGATTGLAASVDALGSASALSKGAFQAIEGAGLVAKFEKGLRFTDYLKSAVPIVNRFGEAGRLSSVGRGYMQGMQLAASAAALKDVSGGGAMIDKATKGAVLGELKQGKGIQEALTAAGRTGKSGGATLDAAQVAFNYNKYGFLQGNVAGKFGVGNGSGNFRFNPFKSTATIAETANPNVFSLGRGVNFASKGGLAQGLGAMQAANGVSATGQYSSAAMRAGAEANKLVTNGTTAELVGGITIADDVQRAQTFAKTADWANKLGVSGGSKFRTLLQLGGSDRAAGRVASIVENGGNQGYRAARYTANVASRVGGFVATPLVAGAAVGLTGKQMQPAWDYVKDRGEIQAREQAAAENATTEQAELERLYAQEHGGTAPAAGTPAAGGGQVTGGGAAAGTAQVVGTSPTGGQLVFDPGYGMVIDTANGDVYDPNTQQLVGNLAQQQGGGQAAAQGAMTGAAQGVAPQAGTAPAAGQATGGGGTGEVYRDPQTGYFVDPTTGLMADPATGQVYDPKSGAVVGNVSGAQQSAA